MKLENQVIGKKYKLIRKIGSGSFGEIYEAKHLKTSKEYAVKIEPANVKVPQLRFEVSVYKKLKDLRGFPRLKWYGGSQKYNAMAMELLGPSLEEIFTYLDFKFNLRTVIMLADQMISRLQTLHAKSFIHRDLKPANFAIGRGNHMDDVYLLDFGLAKMYRDPGSNEHCSLSTGKKLVGTARYVSINAHMGFSQSRRDDIEAVGFVILYFLLGRLPWQSQPGSTKDKKFDNIAKVKMTTSIKDLCSGQYPQFGEFLQKLRRLGFEDEPDYDGYKLLFKDLAFTQGFRLREQSFYWIDMMNNARELRLSERTANRLEHGKDEEDNEFDQYDHLDDEPAKVQQHPPNHPQSRHPQSYNHHHHSFHNQNHHDNHHHQQKVAFEPEREHSPRPNQIVLKRAFEKPQNEFHDISKNEDSCHRHQQDTTRPSPSNDHGNDDCDDDDVGGDNDNDNNNNKSPPPSSSVSTVNKLSHNNNNNSSNNNNHNSKTTTTVTTLLNSSSISDRVTPHHHVNKAYSNEKHDDDNGDISRPLGRSSGSSGRRLGTDNNDNTVNVTRNNINNNTKTKSPPLKAKQNKPFQQQAHQRRQLVARHYSLETGSPPSEYRHLIHPTSSSFNLTAARNAEGTMILPGTVDVTPSMLARQPSKEWKHQPFSPPPSHASIIPNLDTLATNASVTLGNFTCTNASIPTQTFFSSTTRGNTTIENDSPISSRIHNSPPGGAHQRVFQMPTSPLYHHHHHSSHHQRYNGNVCTDTLLQSDHDDESAGETRQQQLQQQQPLEERIPGFVGSEVF
eukprot:TRINITY_DN464_c0_g1_i3.p1 TRINITY_DN464_c0_g1~~TRINITY_DN464_c0_g1_i3.p1  ORF type:complete len:788 (-),score=192.50 TRINITY_DN464_c0_g1_i3:2137-4500(-)